MRTFYLFFAEIVGENWTSLHDGASIHLSKVIKEWIPRKNMDFLQWRAHSPDLDLIENV